MGFHHYLSLLSTRDENKCWSSNLRILAFVRGFPSVSFLSFPLPTPDSYCHPLSSLMLHHQPVSGSMHASTKALDRALACIFFQEVLAILFPPSHPSALSFPGLFPDTFLCWHQAAEFQLQRCPVTLNKASKPSQLLFSWTHFSPSGIKDMKL